MFAQAILMLASITAASGQPQLLCFGASWCEPCRAMQPTLERLSREGYPVRRIDVDQSPDLAQRYQVKAVPNFVLVDGQGRAVGRIDQATTLETLQQFFAHYGIRPAQATVRGQSPPEHAQAIKVSNLPRGRQSSDAPIARGTKPLADRSLGNGASLSGQSVSIQPDPTKAALASTVRLKVEDATGHSFGTGTVIDVHGDEALVLTCGHLFRDSGANARILMDRFDAPRSEQPATGTLISHDIKLDVALVSMKLSRPIPVVRLAPPSYRVQPADAVFSVGCSRGAPPTVVQGKVNQVDKYLGPPNITASGRPVDGRSGGGLFNQHGQLIGVCSAADPEIDEGLYAALPRIYYELDRNGLTFVYQQQEVQPMASDTRLVAVDAPPASGTPGNDRRVGELASTAPVQPQGKQEELPTEVVCVVRGKNDDESRVLVVKNPSRVLLEYLARESNKDVR